MGERAGEHGGRGGGVVRRGVGKEEGVMGGEECGRQEMKNWVKSTGQKPCQNSIKIFNLPTKRYNQPLSMTSQYFNAQQALGTVSTRWVVLAQH